MSSKSSSSKSSESSSQQSPLDSTQVSDAVETDTRQASAVVEAKTGSWFSRWFGEASSLKKSQVAPSGPGLEQSEPEHQVMDSAAVIGVAITESDSVGGHSAPGQDAADLQTIADLEEGCSAQSKAVVEGPVGLNNASQTGSQPGDMGLEGAKECTDMGQASSLAAALTEQALLADVTTNSRELRDQYAVAGLLAELEAFAQAQQFQLEQHRSYLIQARAEQEQEQQNWRTRCALLEAQLAEVRDRAARLEADRLNALAQTLPLQVERDEAQVQAERLREQLRANHSRLELLEGQLEQAEATLREQQPLTQAQARELAAMQLELSRSQERIDALETRLSHQSHLRGQLQGYAEQDRKKRDQARERQLQLEQDSTQLASKLLALGEQLRSTQVQSSHWRQQAQLRGEQLQAIARWAANAADLPSELMPLLEPVFTEVAAMAAGNDPSGILPSRSSGASHLSLVPDPGKPPEQEANGNAAAKAIEADLGATGDTDSSESAPNQNQKSDVGSSTAALDVAVPTAALDLPNFPNSIDS